MYLRQMACKLASCEWSTASDQTKMKNKLGNKMKIELLPIIKPQTKPNVTLYIEAQALRCVHIVYKRKSYVSDWSFSLVQTRRWHFILLFCQQMASSRSSSRITKVCLAFFSFFRKKSAHPLWCHKERRHLSQTCNKHLRPVTASSSGCFVVVVLHRPPFILFLIFFLQTS